MVPIYDHGGIHVFIEYNCISVLLRGFYKSYRIGKNINGKDFPADHDGDDSIYGGQSIWGKIDAICISLSLASKLHYLGHFLGQFETYDGRFIESGL